VATVGGIGISGTELDQRTTQALAEYQSHSNSEVPAELKPVVRRQILERLIQHQLLVLEAKRLGMTATDAEAEEILKRDPFFNENGAFNEAKFQAVKSGNSPQYRAALEQARSAASIRKLTDQALGIGLAAAAPSGRGTSASLKVWAAALIVTGCFQAVVITIGVKTSGNARGAAFGLAAACGYALTATLLKSAVAALDTSVAAFFSSWELYGTAVAGVGALFLLQNALQAGSLVAVQPPLTLGDAIISACYGVTVLGEEVNTSGGLLAIEILAVLAIAVGCIELSRSLAMVHQVQPAESPR
jgi:hypothetical protein